MNKNILLLNLLSIVSINSMENHNTIHTIFDTIKDALQAEQDIEWEAIKQGKQAPTQKSNWTKIIDSESAETHSALLKLIIDKAPFLANYMTYIEYLVEQKKTPITKDIMDEVQQSFIILHDKCSRQSIEENDPKITDLQRYLQKHKCLQAQK